MQNKSTKMWEKWRTISEIDENWYHLTKEGQLNNLK